MSVSKPILIAKYKTKTEMYTKVLLCFCLLLNWVECLPRKSPTFDEILSNRDLSAIIEDYQVEEDDVGTQDFANHFGFGKGNKSDARSDTKTGSVSLSGSNKNKSFKNALKGMHDIRDQQGFYKLGGAHRLGIVDDADFYAQKDAIENDSKGVDVQEEKSYRRGSKTRGFHRIHHKDEFKKDRLFYDDNNSKGTLKRYGGKGVASRAGIGGRIHRGRIHHDMQEGVYGKQGYFDKGSLDKQLEGFANSQGFDGAFKLNQESAVSEESK